MKYSEIKKILEKEEVVFSKKGKDGKEAVVIKMGGKPSNDPFKMVIMKKGKVEKDWGTHPSLKGAEKFIVGKLQESLEEASYGLHIIKYPNGKYGFGGSVPKELAFEYENGGVISDEDFHSIINAQSPAMVKKARKVKGRIFKTAKDAEKEAKKYKFKINSIEEAKMESGSFELNAYVN